ncbi:MAG TPA: hypothetical protein VME21_00895 [Steroidobacteraceae bacterium]|nr:hypothetical protein [Steroidobacteraceae bacterium]
MVPLRACAKTLSILAAALGFAIVASLLPENPYQRWQLLHGTIHAGARWTYERSSFDPTPIDVVFLGPSRTRFGVDAPRLASALEARGLPHNVVNFSFLEEGRNINFATARMMFEHKRPKLVILGVIEKPHRFGHEAFKYLADRSSIVDCGFVGNFDYLPNLLYLPFRQMRLFAADLLPGGLGLRRTFDAADYWGTSIDTVLGATAPAPRELTRAATAFKSNLHPPILPSRFADLEFGDERFYVAQIAALARRHGARVAFLFIPYYTGPTTIQELQFYRRYGPVMSAAFLASHAEWFADWAHLNRGGAHALSDWLVEPVAALLKTAK